MIGSSKIKMNRLKSRRLKTKVKNKEKNHKVLIKKKTLILKAAIMMIMKIKITKRTLMAKTITTMIKDLSFCCKSFTTKPKRIT
jgi:hypothetical protein